MKAWPPILFAVLAGCTLGPDYHRPDMPDAEAFRETPQGWKQAQPSDDIERGKWWEIFGDARLNGLIEKIDVSNQTLAGSAAQYRQALAALGISQAELYPTLDANGTVVRSHSPGSTLGGTTAGRTLTSYGARLTAQWELDLWGRVRRGVEAAEAAARASAGDVAAARLSLQAQLATSYFQLRALDAQARLLDDTVGGLKKSLELTENRYRAGIVARADVVQADAQLKSTLVQTIDLGVQRAQLEHSIAVLTGVPPSALAIASSPPFEIVVPAVPPGMP